MASHGHAQGTAHADPSYGHGHEHGHGDDEPHVVPLITYYKVFAALMVLLVITLVAAAFDFQKIIGVGWLNIAVAMAIAVAKAVIVVLYFMHVKWSSNLVKTFAGATLLWLLIMFVMTLTDYSSRGWLPQAGK